VPQVVTEPVASALGTEWWGMVFPAYRPVLAQVGGADDKGNRFFARRATANGRPIGLALGGIAGDGATAELLSVYVVPDARNVGVATELLRGLESDLRRGGAKKMSGTYMTSNPTIPALEKVFAKLGFDAPERRTVAVRFTPEEARKTPWYSRAKIPEGGTIFPWTELTAEEREALQRSQAERRWIHPDLEPWRFDEGFDPISSVGLRMPNGEVVGWVINHRIAPEAVRYTVSFIRDDLARRGGIFCLYVASIERLDGTGIYGTFVTAAQFPSMQRFVLRRCAPYITFCGETRGVSKTLDGARAASTP
jgi:GNAT superfamily N-acetyltransferase